MKPRWTVDVLHPLEGTDQYGSDLEGHDEANPDTQAVYGWAPAGTTEQGGWQTQVTADLQVYAPAGFRCTPEDLVVVGGIKYQVEGEVEDYTHGPFGYEPGVRVNLSRTTG